MVLPTAPTRVGLTVNGPVPTDSTGQATVAQAAGRGIVDAAYAQQQQAGNSWAKQPAGTAANPGNIYLNDFGVDVDPQTHGASNLHATAAFDFALPADPSLRNGIGDQLGSVLQANEQAALGGKTLTGASTISTPRLSPNTQLDNAYKNLWNNLHPGGAAGPQSTLAVGAAAQVFKNQALATGGANQQPANILNVAANSLDDAVANMRPNAPTSVQRVWNRVNALYAAAGGSVPNAASSPTRSP